MSKKNKYQVIDAGNTALKIITFSGEEIIEQEFFSWDEKNKIKSYLFQNKDFYRIVSSVIDAETKKWLIENSNPDIILNHDTSLPVSLKNYLTPQTLGADRIANAVAANHLSKTENALVIDIGTCIKFDFVSNGEYMGGSISPGYSMRMKSMHHFTGALPLLELENSTPLIGKSTKESMMSGVLNGIHAEINGMIADYQLIDGELTIFLTGGDHKRFDKELKSGIFVDGNLTAKGLYLILKHNV